MGLDRAVGVEHEELLHRLATEDADRPHDGRSVQKDVLSLRIIALPLRLSRLMRSSDPTSIPTPELAALACQHLLLLSRAPFQWQSLGTQQSILLQSFVLGWQRCFEQ